MPNQTDHDGRKRLLRCEKCGTSLVTFLPDLLRYTQEGWPKHCGDTMAVFVEENPAAAIGTASQPKAIPATVPEAAHELLDQAKQKAEEVAADIGKTKELLDGDEQRATETGSSDGN